MTRAQLEASRALWKSRESFRYRRWKRAIRRNDKPGRHKWFTLYEEARTQRRRRDKQIKRLGVTGISSDGAALVAGFEGFVSCPYRDAVGVWTIGYGHTAGVRSSSACLSRQEARALLRRDLDRHYFPAVRKLPTFRKLTQNQVDALTSFVYNVGPGGIAPNTGVGRNLRAIQRPDDARARAAANHLLDWDKAGGRTLLGLTRRRRVERSLFLRDTDED